MIGNEKLRSDEAKELGGGERELFALLWGDAVQLHKHPCALTLHGRVFLRQHKTLFHTKTYKITQKLTAAWNLERWALPERPEVAPPPRLGEVVPPEAEPEAPPCTE